MPFYRKYGVGSGADIWLPIIKRGVVDGAVGADITFASGDVKVSIDGAAVANIGTLPVVLAAGNTAWWKFVFTDAELQGKRILVSVSDSATKAVEDQWFIIETYGHASAMYQADFSAANLPANLVQIGGDTQSGTDLKDFADAGYDPSTNKIEGVKLADTLTTYTGNTPQTGDAFSRIGANGAGLTDLATAANLATVAAKTDNLPSDPADQSLVIAATDAVMSRLGAPAGASVSADVAAVKADTASLLSRITSTLFAGITSLAEWLGLLGGKQTGNSTARTEMRATGAGSGTYDETTDSQQAIRDRGDAAWVTGGGVSGSNSVTFTVRDSVSLTPLIDQAVVIYAADGTTLVDAKRTNASGVAVFSLDSASYFYALPPSAGYSSVSNTALAVDGVEAVTVGKIAIPSAGVSPGTRVVRVIVVGPTGALTSGVVVSARLVKGNSSIAAAFALTTLYEVTTNASGIADLVLITEDQFESGDGEYLIRAPGAGEWRLAIPAGVDALNLQVEVTG